MPLNATAVKQRLSPLFSQLQVDTSFTGRTDTNSNVCRDNSWGWKVENMKHVQSDDKINMSSWFLINISLSSYSSFHCFHNNRYVGLEQLWFHTAAVPKLWVVDQNRVSAAGPEPEIILILSFLSVTLRQTNETLHFNCTWPSDILSL